MPGNYKIKIALNIGGVNQDIIQNYPAFEIISSDYFGSGKLLNKNQGVVIKDAFWEFFFEFFAITVQFLSLLFISSFFQHNSSITLDKQIRFCSNIKQ